MKLLNSSIQPEELFSKFVPASLIGRFFHFPLFRIFVILLFLVPILLINSVVVFQVIEKLDEPIATYVDLVRILITLPLFILSYRFYCSIFEKRDAVEMSLDGALKQWGLGAAVATILVVSFVLLIALFGEFNVVDTRPLLKLLSNFLLFGIGSFFQEFILLCVVYRLTEELAGTWIALFTSLLLFAGVHIVNENETLLSVAMLSLSSLILIAPFILTRRLWVSWGFHAGWNFMQAGVFGMANSGLTFEGWLITEISGPQWVTGGAVGLEATYLSVGIDFLIGAALLAMAFKAGKTLPFNWKKHTEQE